MTIRTDLIVDWSLSPRIITILSPSTEITMQDLVDTCRDLEDDPNALDDEHLLDAAGKEDLGGGVKVGITVTLNNAKIAFEARAGPTYVQCNISGGNLVAIDSDGNSINPIEPTAFTQIVLANSSSATLQEQDAIQYSSYSGGVSVDITSPYTGTNYPTGTPQQPVNNLADAHSIAEERGFEIFYIIGDVTVDDAVTVLDEHIFIGQSPTKTTITIDPAASIQACEFIEANILGTLDGNSTLRNCRVSTLNYVDGFIFQCLLETGTITLAGSATAHFLDCWSGVPGLNTPVINMGGSGQNLTLRNYNGGIALENKTGTDKVSLDINSGQVILENTVTNGEIVVRGVGKLVDTNGDHIHSGTWNGATIINEIVNTVEVAESVWSANTSDFTTSGTFGHFISKKVLTLAQYLGLK